MSQTELEGKPALDAQMAAIYAEHAVAVRQRCLRLTRDATAADDLMQETFARFLARLPALTGDLDPRGYLLATARNIWINQRRQSGDVSAIEIDESRTADDRIENDPLRALLLAEQRREVQRETAGLTERQRRALTLRELGDRSYAEIGSELGLQANAVAQVVWRARTQLRRSLRRSQIDVGVLPDDCRARLDEISERVDEPERSGGGELDPHLAGCGTCRRTLAAFQEAGTRLRGLVPVMPLVAIATRVGSALRVGPGMPSGIGAAAAVTAAVVATAGGGGALMEHYGALPHASGTPRHAPARAVVKAPPATTVAPVSYGPPPAAAHEDAPVPAATPVRLVRRRVIPPARVRHGATPVRPHHVHRVAVVRRAPAAPPAPAPRPAPATPPAALPVVTATVRAPEQPQTETPPPSPATTQRPEEPKTPSDKARTPTDTPTTPPPGQIKKAVTATPAPAVTTPPEDTAKTPPGQVKKARAATPAPVPSESDATPKVPPGQAKKKDRTTTTPAPPATTPVATTPAATTPAEAPPAAVPTVPVTTPSAPATTTAPPTATVTTDPPATTVATDPDAASTPADNGDPSHGNGKGHQPK